MKQTLDLTLNQTQSITLTPQLQQAIRLLQLSSLELQNEIQEQLENNTMLELESEAEHRQIPAENAHEIEVENPVKPEEDMRSLDMDSSEVIPEDLATDSNWEDIYQTSGQMSAKENSGQNTHSEEVEFEQKDTSDATLRTHLYQQMNLTPMSDKDRAIATVIIDSIEEDGLLKSSMKDLLANFTPDQEVGADEIEMVLLLIQGFDPIGVGARDLRECLLIQLRHSGEDPGLLELTKKIIDENFDLLAKKEYRRIQREYKIKEMQLSKVIALIQTLTPRPGSKLSNNHIQYIVPDVVVRKMGGRWEVELNHHSLPRLRINEHYASMVHRADSSRDNQFLKGQLQEAKWFLKSIESRNETLLKVSKCIVDYQKNFFEYGAEAMKPLVLSEIAQAVDMHESTISRVTTQKYMHTPKGIFELKFFFSSHVNTDMGGECSATAIRAFIKKLLEEENPKKPLSDSKIANLLKEQGIIVARRTIAKYRDVMGIASSSERKSLV